MIDRILLKGLKPDAQKKGEKWKEHWIDYRSGKVERLKRENTRKIRVSHLRFDAIMIIGIIVFQWSDRYFGASIGEASPHISSPFHTFTGLIIH